MAKINDPNEFGAETNASAILHKSSCPTRERVKTAGADFQPVCQDSNVVTHVMGSTKLSWTRALTFTRGSQKVMFGESLIQVEDTADHYTNLLLFSLEI